MAKFCPSLMCADLSKLEQEILDLEAAGADMFHIDIMDGHFVPNLALSIEDVKAVKKLSTIPFDVHLIMSQPALFIDRFADLGCDIIYIHAESTVHLYKVLMQIKQRGVKVGVALNPSTPVTVLEDVLALIDVVLIMSVNTGFAGQSFIPRSVIRIKQLAQLIKAQNLSTQIAIDGAINGAVVAAVAKDVEYYVLGTAGLFGKDISYKTAINELRKVYHINC